MKRVDRDKTLKEVNQAIEELQTIKRMLESNSEPVDTLFNWLGTACMAATAAKNTVYPYTSYKEQIDDIIEGRKKCTE